METKANLWNKLKQFEFEHWKSTGYSVVIVEILMLMHAVFLMFYHELGNHAFTYSSIVLLNVYSIIPLIFVYLSIIRGQEISNVTFYFRLLAFWDIFYLYMNSYTWIVNGQVDLRLNGYIISIAVFVDSIWMYYVFWKFMCSWLGKEDRLAKKLETYIKIIVVIGIAFVFGNIYGGYYYTFSPTGIYEKSDTYWLSMIAPSLLVCVIVFYIIRQKISLWNKMFFLSYPIFPFAGALITVNEKGITLLCTMTFLSILLMYTNLFVSKQMENIEYQAEIAHQETEIANEKANVIISQIKPHFLYNSLVAIMEIEGNPPETKRALKNFAKYMRGNIRSIDSKHVIPLENELEHVKQYTSLEMLRFPDIHIQYDLKVTDFSVPPLTVQILVENAILHGISLKEGGGTIQITTKQEENGYVICVEDDGLGFDDASLDLEEVDEQGKTHVGLKNVRMRLKLVGGDLEIRSEVGEGTSAIIRIPCDEDVLTENEDN